MNYLCCWITETRRKKKRVRRSSYIYRERVLLVATHLEAISSLIFTLWSNFKNVFFKVWAFKHTHTQLNQWPNEKKACQEMESNLIDSVKQLTSRLSTFLFSNKKCKKKNQWVKIQVNISIRRKINRQTFLFFPPVLLEKT